MEIMVSNTYNHTPDKWADAVSKTIVNDILITQSHAANLVHAIMDPIKNILNPLLEEAIQNERMGLTKIPEMCSTDLNDTTPFFVDKAMKDILALQGHDRVLKWFRSDEGDSAASEVIGRTINTAKHLERIEYARLHPNNVAATNYKSRFGG